MKLLFLTIGMLFLIFGIGTIYEITIDGLFNLTYGYVFGALIMYMLFKTEGDEYT